MHQPIALQTVVAKKMHILESTVDNEIVMANFTTGSYYGLDPISTYIWQMLTTPRTVAELCTQLCKEFDVDQTTCQEDVLKFLGKMAEEKLIDVAS